MGFQVVASSGHCGTMWLAHVLNHVPGQSWSHEERSRATGGLPWQTLDRHLPSDLIFVPYWQSIRDRLENFEVVGDSNGWPPEMLPAVNQVVPIERVIYLTRNPEAQLESLLTASPVWSVWRAGNREPAPVVAVDRLARYRDIARAVEGEPHPLSPRLLVEANRFMPTWLELMGLEVVVYAMEDLTTDFTLLRELAPLTDVELVALQQQRMNSKKEYLPA